MKWVRIAATIDRAGLPSRQGSHAKSTKPFLLPTGGHMMSPPSSAQLSEPEGRALSSSEGSAMSSLATSEQSGEPKTQYIHSGDIDADPVAGWLVVVNGPGRGGFRPIFVGVNSVGRDASQRISLNFGDEMISREEHAFIAYDDEARRFYLQHGGKANLVRLRKSPVLSPTELEPYDLVRIGKTTLLFIPFCGSEFAWNDEVTV